MTPEQAAGLAKARMIAMAALPPGPDQEADTPIEQRPGYFATDAKYFEDVIARWKVLNLGEDEAACRERALNSYAGIDTPAPADVPPSPPAPITVVTNYQARAALINAGLFDTVAATVAKLGPSSLEYQAWEYANTFNRNSQFIVSMASSLGLTANQVDALFLAASTVA